MTVTDTHKFLTKVEPKELALDAGESGIVRVDLTVPATTASGVGDDLVIVTVSISRPPTSNSSVVHFSVSSPALKILVDLADHRRIARFVDHSYPKLFSLITPCSSREGGRGDFHPG
jgi:hypothetical protein